MMTSRHPNLRRSAWIVALWCVVSSAGAASLSDYDAYQTISLGGGKRIPKNPSDRHALSSRYAVTLDVNRHLITPAFSILAQTGNNVFDFSGDGFDFDLGLLYGRRLTGRTGSLYAGAGVAYVHVERSGRICRVAGIPWDVCATLMTDESFGLLFQVFGDINRQQSFYGWGVGLHLGG